ncbi:hypothetical protein CVT24_006736 [Panaeolus cyanescens]|uniref:Uncharacterized protein n=1 Tax=Panaeolus cyanescens TaxID=181874 RepID=A0A409V9H1_9AGAR|nr:hypothetical protein CVT24_006736 [Panaeolus cyanescens]
MSSNTETQGFAHFCQHFPVQQGFMYSLDAALHPRGPFGRREPVRLWAVEGDPRHSRPFSYVLGDRVEDSSGALVNSGVYGSVIKSFLLNTLRKCAAVGGRVVVATRNWIFT